MKDLIEIIADAIHDYKDKKIGQLDLDSDTDFEIYKMVLGSIDKIKEVLEELDEDIDTTIEQISEPSDYDYDLEQDNIQRHKDI